MVRQCNLLVKACLGSLMARLPFGRACIEVQLVSRLPSPQRLFRISRVLPLSLHEGWALNSANEQRDLFALSVLQCRRCYSGGHHCFESFAWHLRDSWHCDINRRIVTRLISGTAAMMDGSPTNVECLYIISALGEYNGHAHCNEHCN